MVLFIIAAVIALVALGVAIKLTVDFLRNVIPPVPFIKLLKRLGIILSVFVAGFATMMISIFLWAKIKPNGWELTAAIVGGLLVPSFGAVSLFTFLFHYYGKGEVKGITPQIDKWLFRSLMISFPLFIASIFLLTEGYANHLTYPIANGINFQKGFVSPASDYSPNITFYALCILSGALYGYFLCDHKYYLEYGKHGILESTFFVAFPSGILGARLFYVIGNWSKEFNYGNSFVNMNGVNIWAPLAIWTGGLTILGGAVVGIGVGVAWFLWKNKGYNIFVAVDMLIPAILIAQACGRWGNYFNCEVHGFQDSISHWYWLPAFVRNNAQYSIELGWAEPGKLFVPLFFIESITNMLGFFVLAHVFGKALRKYTQYGDIACGYIIWYGLTRVFMEPLRDPTFNMGNNGYWSWIWSLAFVSIGSLLIGINHLVRWILKPRDVNMKVYLIGTIAVSVVSVTLLTVGAILMGTGHFVQTLSFTQYNWGIICLFLGLSVLFSLLVTLPPFFIKKKEQPVVNE